MAAAADPTPVPLGAVDPDADVRTLTPKDVHSLRLGWQSRFQEDEIRGLLASYPGRSVWSPASLEYALAAPWRHRPEIAVVQQLSAVRGAVPLVEGLVERCRAAGDALVLLIELDERRRPSFYERIGFSPLEEVITYELEWPSPAVPEGDDLTFVPVDPADEVRVRDLVRIDHAAFPWLWWNSDPEFRAYGRTPGVELFLGLHGGQAVTYLGITSYPGWGHLDRIAVDPALHGRGFGRRSLAFAVGRLAARGARRVGLSTQRVNLRSRQLYERFGFRRSRGNDYRLYGVALRDEVG